MIRRGGQWKSASGKLIGEGLFHHYRKLDELLWPEDYRHRWSDLIFKTILENKITLVTGPRDSGKTRVALARMGLLDYFCFPYETLIMMTSTDIRGLELRVWGDVKTLFQRAKAAYDLLPGHLLDSKHAICTDNLKEDDVRDLRRGIICIPCLSSTGQWKGLGNFVGVKQKRRRLLSDEVSFMRDSFIDAISNLSTGDFKFVGVGNPIGQNDPLDKMSEPECGWDSQPEPTKTTTWRNKMFGGTTVALIGSDSPNNDFPEEERHYDRLISKRELEETASFYGRNSLQFYSQALGVRKVGIDARRVLTRSLCEAHGAFKPCIWLGTQTTKIYGVDAGYGGDRCVGGFIEFGQEVGSQWVIKIHPPKIIPVTPSPTLSMEDQIAHFVKADCDLNGIPPENVFHDATGRGSLGTSFARIYSDRVNPLEFGGNPSPRPASLDLFVYDMKEKQRRLKRCDEEFSKFVTELWFSVKYAVLSEQVREMPLDVVEEFSMREWGMTKSAKIEIESKHDTKERMGRSPDLADWLSTCVEGARRKGFQIAKLATKATATKDDGWRDRLAERGKALRESFELNYSV